MKYCLPLQALLSLFGVIWGISCGAFDLTYSDNPTNLISKDFFTQQLSWRNPAWLWRSCGEKRAFTVKDQMLILPARANGKRTFAAINTDIGYETTDTFELSFEYCSTGNELILLWLNQTKRLRHNRQSFTLPLTRGQWRKFSQRIKRCPQSYEIEFRFKASRRHGELKIRNLRLEPVALAPRGQIELVGQKADTIYYEKDNYYALYAAKILRSQLWRVKGVILKMAEGSPRQGGIVIGGKALQAQRGGYELTVSPGRAVVRGNLPGGYELGVVALLRCLGIEYFTPYDYTIPEKLTCPAIHQVVTPGVALRRSGIFDRMRELVNYSAPIYWSNDMKIGCGYHGYAHTGPSYLRYDEFFPTHPEYFALQADGQRLRRIPGKNFQTHFCMSNANGRNVVANRIIELMKCEPHAMNFLLDSGDGAERYCRCADCQKFGRNLGERHLLWANDIARKVAQVFPERIITTSAYVDSRFPPEKVLPAPNVKVKYCIYEPSWPSHLIFRHPDNIEGMKELKGWEKCCLANLSATSYCNILGEFLNISPSFYANYEQMKHFADKRLYEVYFYGLNRSRREGSLPSNSSFNALTLKILGLVLVDPAIDVEKAIDRFMAFYYGPGAAPMRQYFNLIHREVKVRNWVQNAEHRRRGFVTPELAARCYRCFDAAYKATQGVYRERIEKEKLRLLWSDLTDNNRGNGKITHDGLPQYAAKLAEFCVLCRKYGKSWNSVPYPRWFSEYAMLKLKGSGVWYNDPLIEKLIKQPLDTLLKTVPDVQKATNYGWYIDNSGLLGAERSKSSWLMANPQWTSTLRRASSGFGTARFNFKLTEVPQQGIILRVCGNDNEKKNPALMALQVNGKKIYAGAVPWSKDEWQECDFEVAPKLLKVGANEVVFFNTTPDQEKDELCGDNFVVKRNYYWGWYSIRDIKIIRK